MLEVIRKEGRKTLWLAQIFFRFCFRFYRMSGIEKVYLPRICGLAAICCVLIGSHSGVKGVKAHVGIRACVHFPGVHGLS